MPQVLILDDSFEHHVWNLGGEERSLFILDLPHPDLPKEQRGVNRFKVEGLVET